MSKINNKPLSNSKLSRSLPDRVNIGETDKPRAAQLLTRSNLQWVLEMMGLRVRFNMMTHREVFLPADADEVLTQDEEAEARVWLEDTLYRCDIHQRRGLDELLAVVAADARYHPMEEWLQRLVWDGEDHIGALVETVSTPNPLWPVYLEKWLIQVVEGVCGWRRVTASGDGEGARSLPHVLVLVGGQGIGKSYWLSVLGGLWFRGEAELHLSSGESKDHQLAVLKVPMVELAELDGIFKKTENAHMKAFLTRGFDELRAPYTRKAVVRPRMTTFCGSVNEQAFLTDSSGSRRFWPVAVDAISRDATAAVNFEQVWAQAYDLWKESPGFQLTAREDALRSQISREEHTSETPEAALIAEFYARHAHPSGAGYQPMTALGVLAMLYGGARTFSPAVKKNATVALTELLGACSDHSVEGRRLRRSWLFPCRANAQLRSHWAQ